MADFRMPSLGADMTEGILVAWRVNPGDRVEQGDVIAEVETAKGLFEVESFNAGVVETLLAEPGPEPIKVGTPLATIVQESTEAAVSMQPPAASTRVLVSPVARRLAEERGIDLKQLWGSGPNGVIQLADVEQRLKTSEDQPPSSIPEKSAITTEKPVETDYRAGIRQAIAAAMSLSNRDIPHYYLATEIDMSRPLDWLAEKNRDLPIKKRLLPAVLTLKAVAKALQKVPQLNAHWIDGELQQRKEIHLGVAIALRGGGLLTPALHHVDRMDLEQLMTALADLIERTRTGKLRGSEMTDAGITVTSLGDLGVQSVYGVIYPPQVALVGLGKVTERPWADHGQLEVRPVLTATLAADHRASDGHLGGQFLDAFAKLLQKPEDL